MISIQSNNAHLQQKPRDMSSCCPTCSRPYPEGTGVTVDFDGNTVLRNGTLIKLTRQEMDLFYSVWKNRPAIISPERIVIRMFGHNADVSANHVRVVMSSVNKKLTPIGVEVQNASYGEGYRIVLAIV